MGDFYGTGIEIWAGFGLDLGWIWAGSGLIGSMKKGSGPIMSNI